MNVEHLILQIALILLVTRLCGVALRFLGQPDVIGEMIGGLLLGPSALGLIDHGALLHWLFPRPSMTFLNVLAQLGVMFFMFIVGLELDVLHLRGKGKTVVAIGLSSLLGSFVSGLVIAAMLLHWGHIAAHLRSPLAFVLLSATAMAMTAFPVLARVITDQNLQKTSLGQLTIAAAAVLDVGGWCLLAAVYDIARTQIGGQGASVLMSVWLGMKTTMLAAAYVIVMMLFVRRFLWRFHSHFEIRGRVTRTVLALALFLLLLSGLVAELLGINMIFGAFMIGLVFPANEDFVRHLTARLEDITLVVLMPIFFVTIGLHTDIARLTDPVIWQAGIWLVIGLLAVKFVTSAVPAKLAGVRFADAGLLGLLMNTHGVVELVVLNLAWQMHAINSRMLTLLVLALLTITIVSSGLLRLIYTPIRRRQLRAAALSTGTGPTDCDPAIHILVPLAKPANAGPLVRIAVSLLGKRPGRISSLYLQTPGDWQLGPQALKPLAPDPLEIAGREAAALGTAIQAITFASRRIGRDICHLADYQRADWIVLGAHRGILDPSALGGVVAHVLKKAPSHVAVLIGNQLPEMRRVLVPYLGESQDIGALLAAERIARNAAAHITIVHVIRPRRAAGDDSLGVKQLVDRLMPDSDSANPVRMRVIESDQPTDVVVEESKNYDLIILGISPLWKLRENLLSRAQTSIARRSACPTLVVQAAKSKRKLAGKEPQAQTGPAAAQRPSGGTIPQ